MDRAQFNVALGMASTVRWYDWVGRTALGNKVRMQSRAVVRHNFGHGVSGVYVKPPAEKS